MGVDKFLSVLSRIIVRSGQSLTRDLNIMLLRTCEFHQNLHRAGHTVFWGVNGITFTCVPTFFSASPPHPCHSTTSPHLAEAWQYLVSTVTAVTVKYQHRHVTTTVCYTNITLFSLFVSHKGSLLEYYGWGPQILNDWQQ